MGASTSNMAFCTACGGLVKYKTSSNSWARSAACNILGRPFASVLPSRASPVFAPVEPEANATCDHREDLLDAGVDVLPGHRTVGSDVQVGDDQLPVGLLAADAGHHPLAGYRVLVDVSCFAHGFSFLRFVAIWGSRTSARRPRGPRAQIGRR